MNTFNERDLEQLLGQLPEGTDLEPPSDLAERIKAEIPEDLGLPSARPENPDEPTLAPNVVPGPWLRQRRWLMAAGVATMLGGSFLAYRLYTTLDLRGAAPAADTALVSETAPTTQPAVSERWANDDTGLRSSDSTSTTEAALPTTSATADFDQGSAPRSAEGGADPGVLAERGTYEPPGAPKAEPAPSRSPVVAGDARTKALPAPAAPPPFPPPPPPPARFTMPSDSEVPRSRAARSEAKRVEIEGRLRALGYVDGSEAESGEVVEESIIILDPPPGARAPTEAHNITVLSERQLAPVSTGGTAEPNDAPYGDVFFRGYGTNPFIATEDDRLSTFGLDVDTASYTIVRRNLRDGHLPDPDAVRLEELVNAFDYRDAPPEEGDFALHAEAAPALYGENDRTYLLRFAIQGRDIDDAERASAQLTFVVDVSGSMGRENRLGLVKRSLALLIGQLRPDDRLALVVYGSRGRVLLEPTSDHGAIRRAIEQLRPEGSTNAEEGLRLAYELAARYHRPGTINRVILCSDGVANVGATSAGSILDRIRHHAEQGIELTTLGFGMGNYNDVLMEQLANRGNGRYAYVDTLDEAHRVLVEDLTGTLQTLAAEARSQVEFNPALVDRYRLLGYENRDIADERFRDDTVDAGEIGMGHRVTVLYEVVLKHQPGRRDTVATLRLRYASIAARKMVELERRVSGSDFAGSWKKASPALRLSSLVAEWAEALRGSYWARDADLDDVFRRAQKLAPELAGDQDIAELVVLMGQTAELRSRDR